MKSVLQFFFFSMLIVNVSLGKGGDVWDQEKAEAKVREVLRIEAKGEPWNEIEWMIDAEKAAALAEKTQKPIFLYFYIKTSVGPKNDTG